MVMNWMVILNDINYTELYPDESKNIPAYVVSYRSFRSTFWVVLYYRLPLESIAIQRAKEWMEERKTTCTHIRVIKNELTIDLPKSTVVWSKER